MLPEQHMQLQRMQLFHDDENKKLKKREQSTQAEEEKISNII